MYGTNERCKICRIRQRRNKRIENEIHRNVHGLHGNGFLLEIQFDDDDGENFHRQNFE